MKRNLRFWTRYTWECVLAELIIVGVILLVSAFNSDPVWAGGLDGWLDYLALAPFYLIIAAVISVMMLAPGCQMIYIPLLVSHGEPRKNVYWGYQYHRFLIIAVTSAASGLVWTLVPGEVSAAFLSCLPTIAVGLVISSSLGDLMGVAYVRWKWIGVTMMVLFFGICGGLAGWSLSSGKFDIAGMSTVMLGAAAISLPWQLALVAAVLLAVDLGVQWLLLRRREVKF